MWSSVSDSARARIEWCIATVRSIADLGRHQPLGDLYPQAVMVTAALKVVLEPNVFDEWEPVGAPPLMTMRDVGWLSSEPVLVFCTDGQKRLATFEQVYEDSSPVWYSKCSERWDLTEQVTHWIALPDGPIF